MATILCVTSRIPGVLFAGVELARRLAHDGHRVVYASFESARQTVVDQELEFLALEPGSYEEFLAADAEEGLFGRLRHLESRQQEAAASLAVDGFAKSVRKMAPDLVLIDGEMHEHILAVAGSGVTLALLNFFVSIWRRPGLPPPHHLAHPGVGWKGTRLGTWLLWQELRAKKWRRAWSQKIGRVGCDRMSLLRRLARDYGFDFRRETDDSQWLIPFTYRRLPVLSLHAREFEFPHRPPRTVCYVGPMVLETRGDEQIDDAVRGELERIYARSHDDARALIYAGFGSFFSTDRGFLSRLFDAVAARSDWDLVVSLGGQAERDELGRLPDNVHAFAWLPQPEVLRHADAAVVHGGINTIDECVLGGVPMLVYCGFETDMAGNTSRVAYHELGLAGDLRRDGPLAIREKLDRLLRETRYRDSVERFRTLYEAYAVDRVAERTVASFLDTADAETVP